jgi:TolB protein
MKRHRGIVVVLAFITVAGTVQPAQPSADLLRIDPPAVSPDGSRIAFLSNKEGEEDVYVVARDGTGEVRITNTLGYKDGANWSSDGQHLWFSAFADGVSRIYSIDPDGRNLKQIGTVPGQAATLSHNGKRVLYSAGGWMSIGLYVSNLDGSDARILADGAPYPWNVRWSPDDKRIAYTKCIAYPAPSPEEIPPSVWVMNADGSQPRQITHLAPGEGSAMFPEWSPDGRQIVMEVNDPDWERRDAHIWVVDVETGAAHNLTPHAQPYLDMLPSWFPDGKQIAFQSQGRGHTEIWVMNADGSDQHPLKAAK